MNTFVVDASVAVKWVVEEEGTTDALSLRRSARLLAPELLVAECANVFWKKFQRKELTREQAVLAAKLIQGADIEFLPMRGMLETATRLAIELDSPAYDCVYIALALQNDCKFITADDRFLQRVNLSSARPLRGRAISLVEAAGSLR
ncbi:MAG TPA: type II toxin-antitoxin system VapC family toxin [Micropepsaceae bacterium]|nr:type II toxin-antitoxin system VapC family toxin [Micropepsaceae bacterium]